MKKYISTIILLFSITTILISQNDWHYLSGVDAEPNRYDDVYFIDSMHGWACGPESVIRTTDAGITWDTIARNFGYGHRERAMAQIIPRDRSLCRQPR